MKDGIPLKFFTPGGSSTPIFTAEHLDVPLSFEDVAAAGSMLGTTALMCFNETVSVPWAVWKWTRVLQARVLRQVHPVPRGHRLAGADPAPDGAPRGHAGGPRHACPTPATTSSAASFCALGDGATTPIPSSFKYFRQEFEDLVHRRSPGRAPETSWAH